MNRRNFLKTAGVGAGAMMMPRIPGRQNASSAQASVKNASQAKNLKDMPNILIIHTDQQNRETLSILGANIIDTPNIDRIGQEGAVFNNFYTNVAVCTPSRGCFLTGRYHHSHGAEVNGRAINQDEISFANVLQDYGYDTGYAGKWHLDGYDLRPGWVHPERSLGFKDCHYMANDFHGKKIKDGRQDSKHTTPYDHTYLPVVYPLDVIGDEESYTTDFFTTKAIDFIEKERENPFCYMLSIPDPHHPWSVRAPYDTMFDPREFELPKTFSEENLPCWAKNVQNNGEFNLDNPDREKNLRKKLALYYGMVKLIDDSMARIFAALERKSILDDTIIIFTSDHGDYNGQHGLFEKNMLYDSVYHIPFLVRYPKAFNRGTVIDEYFSTVDFMPSLMSFLGINGSGREQGKVMPAFSRDRKNDWKNEVYISQHMDGAAGIITPEYELAFMNKYYSYSKSIQVQCKLAPPHSDGILFDRKNDPWQERNLINKPEYSKVVAELTQRIIEHSKNVQSPMYDWLKAMA